MTVIPYLTFDGTCLEAMTFYADVFNTEIDTMMRAGDQATFWAAGFGTAVDRFGIHWMISTDA